LAGLIFFDLKQKKQTNTMATALPSNDIINISLIHNQDDLTKENVSFHPEFSHQLFPDEKIEGHGKPRVNLIYHAAQLQLCLQVTEDPIKGSPAITDLISPIRKFLSLPTFPDVSEMLAASNPAFVPHGEKVGEYTLPGLSQPGVDVKYEIFSNKVTDPAFAAFHKRLQFFTILFIDGASYIDENDTKWTVFTLFERKEQGGDVQYSFVGFSTVYDFFAYPESIRKRLSQFFILPPFWRQGHGFRLLNIIYSAIEKTCVEICVEDPTDQFQQLRLTVELAIANRNHLFDFHKHDVRAKYWTLTKETLEELARQTRFTKNSIRRLHEIFKYEALGPAPTDDETKAYRLAVKSRLFSRYEDELEAMEAEERKAKLKEMYECTLEENKKLLHGLREGKRA
jgi:histone acetyltransferase 1